MIRDEENGWSHTTKTYTLSYYLVSLLQSTPRNERRKRSRASVLLRKASEAWPSVRAPLAQRTTECLDVSQEWVERERERGSAIVLSLSPTWPDFQHTRR